MWLVFAPFDAPPGLTVKIPDFTLDNFRRLFDNPYAVSSLLNSVLISRRHDADRDRAARRSRPTRSRGCASRPQLLLYGAAPAVLDRHGTAAMVPIFLLMFQLGLIDDRSGVAWC